MTFIQRKSWLKRSAPPRKKRPGPPRRGEPTSEEKGITRLAVYERAHGKCELRLHKDCSRDRILPFEGDVFTRAHLVHLLSKRRFGWREGNGQAHLLGCPNCHLISVHQRGEKITIPERGE